ncbi:MAG: aldolase [Chloroflexi bacterium]|nr:aldolase [Chloroflexota bacterium]|tara:strand:- start:325 stop:1092 length:768 start_codon:yes stop_codon:yes gene_type:complete
MVKQNLLKGKLENGETVIGPFCIVPSMTMIDTLGYSGMDFCILDTEHGPMDLQTITDLCIAADGTGVSPIVRVGENNERLILRALDVGSSGVQVPQINQKSDAEEVVQSAKYSPIGHRGLSIFTRAGEYFKHAGKDHTDNQNDNTLVIVHIEGQRGLNNLDEIMSVDGIDVLFLGPYDISQSLGIPGQVTDPKVEKAIREATDKARSLGRYVGSYAKDVEMGKWLIDIGVQYLSINTDATIYMQSCEKIVNDLRK